MEDVFKSLVTEEPDRGEELEEEEISNAKSASEMENTSPNDSDLETTLKRLFPIYDTASIQRILPIAKEICYLAPIIMLGRVFPDNFSTKVYLITTNLAVKHADDPTFDVIETMMIIEGLCQIGLEGKGRVEAVIVSGNTKEVAEQEASRGSF